MGPRLDRSAGTGVVEEAQRAQDLPCVSPKTDEGVAGRTRLNTAKTVGVSS
jgi:hypothetical protein